MLLAEYNTITKTTTVKECTVDDVFSLLCRYCETLGTFNILYVHHCKPNEIIKFYACDGCYTKNHCYQKNKEMSNPDMFVLRRFQIYDP